MSDTFWSVQDLRQSYYRWLHETGRWREVELFEWPRKREAEPDSDDDVTALRCQCLGCHNRLDGRQEMYCGARCRKRQAKRNERARRRALAGMDAESVTLVGAVVEDPDYATDARQAGKDLDSQTVIVIDGVSIDRDVLKVFTEDSRRRKSLR